MIWNTIKNKCLLGLGVAFALGACSQPEQPSSDLNSRKVKVGEENQERRPASRPIEAPSSEQGLKKWGLAAENLYYGIYLNGSKMGWMNSHLSATDTTVEAFTKMEAKITGMGTVSGLTLEEKRSYRSSDGVMTAIRFSQVSATGSVLVEGKRVGEQLELSVTAGEVTTKKRVPAAETLEDLRNLHQFLTKPQMGKTVTIKRFDPSALQLLTIEHSILSITTKVFGGVEVDTINLESKYPQMGLSEQSMYDSSGTLLETKVGGFFVARLEPKQLAKELDYEQDLLISAVVKTPSPISRPEKLSRLEVDFEGFEDFAFPSSARLLVSKNDKMTTLKLKIDGTPPRIELAKGEYKGKYIEATPFIQSGEAEIIKAANQAIGNAKDSWTAVERLVSFVYTHIQDEYVASFSNAMEALKSGRGDCTEHSVLFVALARAIGIPARSAVGIAYWPAGKGFGWHAWAEVKIGKQWYAVDPTWNQPLADATHIKLAEGGPAEQARIVMLLGSLRVVGVRL